MMMRMYKGQKISISHKYEKNVNFNIEFEDDKARLTILDLPNEIVLKIFSYLESTCLLRSVSLVCKAWKALAEDPSLWKQLELICLYKECDFVKVLHKYKFVQELSIFDCKIGSRFLRVLSQLSGLRSLKLIQCIIPQFQVKGKVGKLSLTSLNLSYVEFAYRVFDIIDLNFLKCFDFTHYIVDIEKNLIASLKQCTQLENLCLHVQFQSFSDEFNNETINSIIQIFPGALVGISIRGNTERSFLNLSKCSKLSKFIHYGKFSDLTLLQIMKLRNLEDLRLNLLGFTSSENVVRMFTEGNMSNLISLVLQYCNTLNDLDIITIANHCKKLSTLILQYNNKITDVGVSAILNNCSNIAELRLVSFTNLKGTFLLEIIKENLLVNLKRIDVYNSIIERKYVAAFEAARPDVQILEDFSIF